MKVGDEWIRSQEMNVTEDDQSLCVDHFWKKVFTKKDNHGDQFEVLPKMVKCALALCHSNADVERSLIVNKGMLTKQNVSMKDETIIGLKATKAAVQDYGGVQNVPITLDMIKIVEKSQYLYTEHLIQEAAKKSTKEGERAKQKLKRGNLKKRKLKRELYMRSFRSWKWMIDRHMMQWEKQWLTLMKVERKCMMDSKQAIWWKLKQETNW